MFTYCARKQQFGCLLNRFVFHCQLCHTFARPRTQFRAPCGATRQLCYTEKAIGKHRRAADRRVVARRAIRKCSIASPRQSARRRAARRHHGRVFRRRRRRNGDVWRYARSVAALSSHQFARFAKLVVKKVVQLLSANIRVLFFSLQNPNAGRLCDALSALHKRKTMHKIILLTVVWRARLKQRFDKNDIVVQGCAVVVFCKQLITGRRKLGPVQQM